MKGISILYSYEIKWRTYELSWIIRNDISIWNHMKDIWIIQKWNSHGWSAEINHGHSTPVLNWLDSWRFTNPTLTEKNDLARSESLPTSFGITHDSQIHTHFQSAQYVFPFLGCQSWAVQETSSNEHENYLLTKALKKIIPARDPNKWGGEKEARLVVVMMMTMIHRWEHRGADIWEHMRAHMW